MERLFRVVLEPNGLGGYTALVPILPGCISEGDFKEEALENIKEAIEGYMESLQVNGEPIPSEGDEEIVELHRFLIVIEKAKNNYSVYSPDLPGCIATGRTPEETKRRMVKAVEMHIRGLREDGLPIPQPSSSSGYVAVGE